MIRLRKLTLETSLQLDQIETWFKKNTHPIKNIFFDSAERTDKLFKGKIQENDFEVVPTIRYRNSFLPILQGSTRRVKQGSEITLMIGIHSFVGIFLAAIILFSIIWAVEPILTKMEFHIFDLSMFISIIIVTSIMSMLFYTESERCIKKIKENLDARKK
jgi:hypothetical protein